MDSGAAKGIGSIEAPHPRPPAGSTDASTTLTVTSAGVADAATLVDVIAVHSSTIRRGHGRFQIPRLDDIGGHTGSMARFAILGP
jgi:hypothetical protein